jgi:hypothetical protein
MMLLHFWYKFAFSTAINFVNSNIHKKKYRKTGFNLVTCMKYARLRSFLFKFVVL